MDPYRALNRALVAGKIAGPKRYLVTVLRTFIGSVFAVVDSSSGEIVAGPHIQARGMAEDESVFDQLDLAGPLAEAARDYRDAHQLEQVLRRSVGQFASRKLRRRPMIIPVVIET